LDGTCELKVYNYDVNLLDEKIGLRALSFSHPCINITISNNRQKIDSFITK